MKKVVKKKQTKPDKKPRKKLKQQPRVAKHKAELLKAMIETKGNVTDACKMTGLNRDTYYEYMRTDPKFKHIVEDVAEMRIDFVEKQLDKLIEDMDSKAITFFLKTKGKHRGYVERTEVDANINDGRLTGDIFAEAWKTAQIKKKPKKIKPKKR